MRTRKHTRYLNYDNNTTFHYVVMADGTVRRVESNEDARKLAIDFQEDNEQTRR